MTGIIDNSCIINELVNDNINEHLNDSYKRAFNNTINEWFTSLNKPSVVVFKFRLSTLSLEITLISKPSPKCPEPLGF